MPGIGSWEWVGHDFVSELRDQYCVSVWRDLPPQCDIVIAIKYGFDQRLIGAVGDAQLVYCPIDAFGSGADIDRAGVLLCRCARIIVHARPLLKYFRSYAPVEYLDHALRYVSPLADAHRRSGPILWAGLQSNLPPLVSWVNENRIPGELRVLTDCDDDRPSPGQWGFSADNITVESWTRERHIECAGRSRAALDIKGDDFRQRHKPPAKALDFIASGLPLAMNSDSASSRHLAELGFDVASPSDTSRWLSAEYWHETQELARHLRQSHTLERVGQHLCDIVESVLRERGMSQ
jgi:hypothetical protein